MLYRFGKEDKTWKTRGKGHVRLLQHKENKMIRVVLREDKTLKLRMNHLVNAEVELQPNSGSEKSWTWATTDYATEAAGEEETFAIKFRTEQLAGEFKRKHDEARALNAGKEVAAASASPSQEEAQAEEVAAEAGSSQAAATPA